MIYRKSMLYMFVLCATVSLTPKLYSFEISLPKTGTSFACSIGASSAFIAASYILTQHYKSIQDKNKNETTTSPYRFPPAEFWWAILTASACIAALFLFTDDSTPIECIQKK